MARELAPAGARSAPIPTGITVLGVIRAAAQPSGSKLPRHGGIEQLRINACAGSRCRSNSRHQTS
ncbi:hypothetical protein FHK92_02940 [Pseudomonas brassicacearum subsp. neoaurantiaca]|uniref:Uncharacterized protein n=1 Tax=Pseudomonas brassicacearum subsp. neoaurantiaca TaxID=494916 RepID=A0A7V8RHV8_9PSED|nr:hypothetical protein [Pseudomonas brassicacearum subsp. neoaurantiaca]